MKMKRKITDRLQVLITNGEALLRTRVDPNTDNGSVIYCGSDFVDSSLGNQWVTSCASLIRQTLGENSEHYTRFSNFKSAATSFDDAEAALAVLKAFEDDINHGAIFDISQIIHAEVFGDFLEMAEHLVKGGYKDPAAVIVGGVLEDSLRKLCNTHNLSVGERPRLDSMNSQLAKAGVYNKLVQKQITALAHTRNNAAHAKWEEFSLDEVKRMLADVRSLLASHLVE